MLAVADARPSYYPHGHYYPGYVYKGYTPVVHYLDSPVKKEKGEVEVTPASTQLDVKPYSVKYPGPVYPNGYHYDHPYPYLHHPHHYPYLSHYHGYPILDKYHHEHPVPVKYGPYYPHYASKQTYGHVTYDQKAHTEVNPDGTSSGYYSYISPEGKEVVVEYTADERGFQVKSNALPEAPVGPDGSFVPEDTPEVKEAKEAHLKAVEAAKKATGPSPSDVPKDTPEVQEAKEAHYRALAAAEARDRYRYPYWQW